MIGSTVLIILFVVLSMVAFPAGMAIIASKRGYSVVLFAVVGAILGPGIMTLAGFSKSRYSYIPGIASLCLGFVVFIVALCIRGRPRPLPEITLQMPLPPEQEDAEKTR